MSEPATSGPAGDLRMLQDREWLRLATPVNIAAAAVTAAAVPDQEGAVKADAQVRRSAARWCFAAPSLDRG